MTPDYSPLPSLASKNFNDRGPLIYRMQRLAAMYTNVQQSIELLTIEYNNAAKRAARLGTDPDQSSPILVKSFFRKPATS